MTGSSAKAWAKAYKGPGKIRTVCCYPTLGGLVEAHARLITQTWAAAGHTRVPRVSVSRSIFPLMNDLDRAYFGGEGQETDQFGIIDSTRAVFGRGYAAEPDVLVEQLRKDEAIAEADTLLLTVPNQLGVAYNVHVMESILTAVAPGLGWR